MSEGQIQCCQLEDLALRVVVSKYEDNPFRNLKNDDQSKSFRTPTSNGNIKDNIDCSNSSIYATTESAMQWHIAIHLCLCVHACVCVGAIHNCAYACYKDYIVNL
jgi:hypothetical protein